MTHATFYRDGEAIKREPYAYKACGLDGITLRNGYEREEVDGEFYVTIKDVDGLHRAIGNYLVLHRKVLSPKEIRFLRKTLNLTQAELGRKMGQSSQQVARWEKGQSEIPGPADRFLRFIFLIEFGEPGHALEALKSLTDTLDELDETENETVQFCLDDEDDWEPMLKAA